MKPYSKDLRLKVLAAVDRGMPRGEVTGTFGVSPATVKRWLKKRRETGDVDPEPIPGPPARKREALEERLPAQTESNPDLTLAEHCELFGEESGVEVSTATMSRALERLGLPLKKSRSRLPSETRRRGLAGEKERGG
jgi:transposase